MPLTSMLNVTSICGTPRGAGGMSVRLNVPSRRLSLANSRSPCSTLIVTAVWLSAAVREGFLLARRDRRVARDQRGHHAAERFDAQRQRRGVQHQDVLDVAGGDAALDRRADRDDFVGVDASCSAPCP